MSGAVNYIKRTVLPVAFLGLVGAAVGTAYEFPFDNGASIKSFVDKMITTFIGWIKLSPTSGAGYIIMLVVNLFVKGMIMALAIFIATRFVNVPGPARVAAPLANL